MMRLVVNFQNFDQFHRILVLIIKFSANNLSQKIEILVRELCAMELIYRVGDNNAMEHCACLFEPGSAFA